MTPFDLSDADTAALILSESENLALGTLKQMGSDLLWGAKEDLRLLDEHILQPMDNAIDMVGSGAGWLADKALPGTGEGVKRVVVVASMLWGPGKGRAVAGSKSLRSRMGAPPPHMKKPQAHHNLPQKFRDRFAKKGIDIDDPAYGRWVEGGPTGDHQKWSKQFEREWDDFFRRNPDPSKEAILDKMNQLRTDPRFQ